MTRPQPIEADFDELYRKFGTDDLKGTVRVNCLVEATGDVKNCRVTEPQNPGPVDQAIAEQVESWRMKPATLNGKPIDLDYDFTFNFKGRQ